MAQAYERIIASSTPLTAKGVLWIDTKSSPGTLNRFDNGCWRPLSTVDLSGIAKQGDNPNADISKIYEKVSNFASLEVATESIVRAMWGRGYSPFLDAEGYFIDLNTDADNYLILDGVSLTNDNYLQLIY